MTQLSVNFECTSTIFSLKLRSPQSNCLVTSMSWLVVGFVAKGNDFNISNYLLNIACRRFEVKEEVWSQSLSSLVSLHSVKRALLTVSRKERVRFADKAKSTVDCQRTKASFHPIMTPCPATSWQCSAQNLTAVNVNISIANRLTKVSGGDASIGGKTEEQTKGLRPHSRGLKVVGTRQIQEKRGADLVTVFPGHGRLVSMETQPFLEGGCH